MPTLADQIAPKPQQPSGLGGWLASIGDEMAGAFARYGRRSGAQRDASLALLNQASAPGTDPIMGAGQKLLGLAGLITHPLAFFPTREEWDQRLQAAGNDGRMSRSIGGFLSDLPNLIDPQMAAGGAVLATAPLAAKMLNKADDVADAGIIAYHGSPHSFDKFDMSKIGTGEGAQAYGHGLYFAEAEDVAKTYRDQITKQATGNDQALERATRYLNQNGGDYEAAYNDLLPQRNSAAKSLEAQKAKGRDTTYMESDLANYDAALNALKSKAPVNGSMYQVKINVKPDELLDWDKPLSEHPEHIKGALRKLYRDRGFDNFVNKGFTGEDIASRAESLEQVNEFKNAGIKGVRYKDAGSRGGEGGTYNYVIFDDKLVSILKKYGIPMTAGAGGAMMVAGQDMPPEIAAQMGGT